MTKPDQNRIDQLETRIAEMESVLNVMPQLLQIRAARRDEAARARLAEIAARRDLEELRALCEGDRRNVLSMIPLAEVVSMLLALPDPREFNRDLSNAARASVETKLADLEPCIELGCFAFGTTRSTRYALTIGQYEAVKASRKLSTMMEMRDGLWCLTGPSLVTREIFERADLDLLLKIDTRLAEAITSGRLATRELTREELEDRARENIMCGVAPSLRRTPRKPGTDSTPATYDAPPKIDTKDPYAVMSALLRASAYPDLKETA